MLRVEGLKVRGLPPLSFEVAAGECLAVEGPSGSGKTLLLRAIADLDEAEGLVLLEGVERAEMPAPDWRRLVRYVAAEPAWWTPTPRGGIEETSATLRHLQAVGLEPALLDRDIAMLSTGERQRLALVRALADAPKLVLLDEPTSALDQAAMAMVEEHLKFLLLQGRALVLISHDPAQIERLAGTRLQLGPPDRPRGGP